MNKENSALKLVNEIILYYDERSKKHHIIFSHSLWFICAAERVLKDINPHNTAPAATSFPLCAV